METSQNRREEKIVTLTSATMKGFHVQRYHVQATNIFGVALFHGAEELATWEYVTSIDAAKTWSLVVQTLHIVEENA